MKLKTDVFSGPKNRIFLHLAPEPGLRTALRRRFGASYYPADLADPSVKLKMDICNINFPENSFDIIFCSHVLEHVPDDQKAMREFSRTLKPDGFALFMVPVTGKVSFEDPSITDPAERDRLFGPDHRRIYGPDFEDRLRANGFNVTCTYPREILTPEEIERMGIDETDQVYHCTKAARG